MKFWRSTFIIFVLVSCGNQPDVPRKFGAISLLILTGRNNHEWEKTTPLLVKMYENSQRFKVKVTAAPDTLNYAYYSLFDVVVSNWSAWPEHEYRWPQEAEDGLVQFVEEGGGFVLIHAASATFYLWDDYQEMAGTTWGDSTRHGTIAPHKIVIEDQDHPITSGMNEFWITDELWVNAGVNSNLSVLASSYSDPSNKGRGTNEPVMHWKQLGKGRVFHNILGHNERAMKNTGWKTLMLRGTEWAATGKVTIPVPPDLSPAPAKAGNRFSWQSTDTTLALLNSDDLIWQYNFNTAKGKPYFHPVRMNGATLTWLSPEDHPWHLGIWHSWKFINGVNYWEYDLSDGVPPFDFLGITEVRNIRFERYDDFSCRFLIEIFYHEKSGKDLLKEERIVSVSSPGEKGDFFIDYKMHLTALDDSVEFNRTPLPDEPGGKEWGGYAGLSIRFSQDLFDPKIINADGSNELKHGQPMKWRYYGLRDLQGDQVGTAIFDHTENLNHPSPWFMTDYEDHPFYYFSPAPIFYKPIRMVKGEQRLFRYRMKFYTEEVSKAQLELEWQHFVNEKQ